MNLNTTAKDSSSKNVSNLTFGSDKLTSELICIGRKDSLTSAVLMPITSLQRKHIADFTKSNLKIVSAMFESIKDSGTATTFISPADGDELLLKFTIILLPSKEKISRNNHPFSPHKLTDMLNDYGLQSASKDKMVQIEVIDEDINEYACCIATAIAKTLPMYHSKSTKDSNSRKRKDREEDETESNIQFPGIGGVSVLYGNKEGKIPLDSPLYKSAQVVADRVRFSAKLGDMPPAELNPTKYSEICNGIYKGLKHMTGQMLHSKKLSERN